MGIPLGWMALLVGPALLLLSCLDLFFTAEGGCASAYRPIAMVNASDGRPSGLEHTFGRALERLQGPRPRLVVFSSPLPSYAVARSPWEFFGTILVSQGLISLLRKDQLRAVLKESCASLPQAGSCTLQHSARSLASDFSRWHQAGGVWANPRGVADIGRLTCPVRKRHGFVVLFQISPGVSAGSVLPAAQSHPI